jgi:serine/threonine protein kinase
LLCIAAVIQVCGQNSGEIDVDGDVFGQYRLLDELGRGGMGRVYRAYDTATERIVAIKVLPPHLADDEKFQRRFRAEARIAAGLNEPHVVPIHRFGEIDGRLFVDMRLIEGNDLESVLTHGPVDPKDAVSVVTQVAAALAAAHRVGLVHRDVKPSNILVTGSGFAYLIDFGIARGAGETSVTSTGLAVGTFAYMAPERFAAGEPDQRSDVYSLACVLHECLTGARPYAGDSFEQQIAGHLMAPPPRPSADRPGVPSAFDRVIERGMAKDPNERYATATELADAAREALDAAIGPTLISDRPEVTTERSTSTAPTPAAASAAATQWAPTQLGPRQQTDPVPPQSPTNESGAQRHAVALTAAISALVVTVAVPAIIWGANEPAAEAGPRLVTIDDVNAIMGTSDLKLITINRRFEERYHDISPAECNIIDSVGTISYYLSLGVTEMNEHVLHATGDARDESVDQLVVEAPSAEAAQQFLNELLTTWQKCSGNPYESSGRKATATVTDTGPSSISAEFKYDGEDRKCERTVGIQGRTVAEASACGDNVTDESQILVSKILKPDNQ